jgi:hypothetical protein
MNVAARMTDLTRPVTAGEPTTAMPQDFLNLAVPSGNADSEPGRVQVVRGEVASRIVGRVVQQLARRSLDLPSSRQACPSASGRVEPTNEVAAPAIRTFNWTRANTFVALQEWEGVVLTVTKHDLTASLTDLTAGIARPTEQVTIPLSEFNEDDLPNLVPGRIFRWAIGYLRLKSGTKKRVSNIVFRDLPRWSRRDLAEAEADSERMLRFLNDEPAGAV